MEERAAMVSGAVVKAQELTPKALWREEKKELHDKVLGRRRRRRRKCRRRSRRGLIKGLKERPTRRGRRGEAAEERKLINDLVGGRVG